MLEQLQPVGPPVHDLPLLVVGEPGDDDVQRQPRLVDGGNHAVARTGQRPGARHHLLQNGFDVEARADAQDGRAQVRMALEQSPVRVVGCVVAGHRSSLTDTPPDPVQPGPVPRIPAAWRERVRGGARAARCLRAERQLSNSVEP